MILTYNDGLEAAAQFLDKTAADFEQMAAQIRRTTRGAEQRMKVLEMESVARILHGQANHIRERKLQAPPLRRV